MSQKINIPSQFCPRVVLFDMDGVLYNSMPNHATAWQEAMAAFNIPFTAADAYATEGARGVDTIRKYAKELLGKEFTEAEAQKVLSLKVCKLFFSFILVISIFLYFLPTFELVYFSFVSPFSFLHCYGTQEKDDRLC